MKTLTFNINSWHARFIDHHHGNVSLEHYGNLDICRYTRLFFEALASCIIGWSLITLFSFLAVHAVFGVIFSLMNGMWIFTPAGAFGAIITLVILAIIGAVVAYDWIQGYMYERRCHREENNLPDSFVVNAYKSFKDKYCVRVKIVDPDDEEDDTPAAL